VPPLSTFILREGDRGEEVRRLQTYLQTVAGSYPALPLIRADGIFGPRTREAVEAFQRQFGLPVDGIVTALDFDTIAGVYADLTQGATRQPGQYPGAIQGIPAPQGGGENEQ
jgi:peptidoglycan hydrolase-like protein with peptidoglycan-binding domain